ncbi:MAG TPA: 2-oxoglutarate and iron-dependent oxygenase domain-containing protein [Acidimicrobiales bacterium]
MTASLPVVDVAPLLSGGEADRAAVGREIDAACREVGFFYVVGHGVDDALQSRLDELSRAFFALPDEQKAEIAMARGGRAWRGWFAVGEELTSGVPDLKEGIYFGAELAADHPRVAAAMPLHGRNLFPREPAGFGDVVLAYMDAMTGLGQAILGGMALGLGRPEGWFRDHLTRDPLVLFRIFHYPPAPDAPREQWGVGEHTDYGLLTLLRQDGNGGLSVRSRAGWVDAPPIDGSFVCNLGDMLERLTGDAYRSTPHRVRNAGASGRLSFPFFLDPSWDGDVGDGTYGAYILHKVAKVFPDLATEADL